MFYRLDDVDAAYANTLTIVGGEDYPAQWAARAERFRAGARCESGIFWPDSEPAGLAVFIHGGFWMGSAPQDWSHMAAGAIANGWAVLVPAYPLAPPARISEMTRAVAERITEAARHVAGPVVITGHSAGGHLAARMACEGVLPDDVARRVRHVMPISALFDLRVFLGSRMNETLGLTCKEADAESPALLRPISGTRLTSWVGGAERAEFLRQSALLPNIWTGLGAETEHVIEPDRHHFNVVEGLEDGAHPMTRRLLGLDHRP